MADDIEVGRMSVPVFADLEPFKRQSKAELREAARKAGRAAGKDAGDQVVAALERQYKLRIADAREELARGLIDRKEYQKRGREAAEAFNKGILKEIEKTSTSGRVDRRRFIALSDQIKLAGIRGAEEASTGIRDRFTHLNRWVRGAFAVGILGAFTFVGGQIIGAFRRVAEAVQSILLRAGNVQQIRQSFENITASAGLVSTRLLENLRQATRGLASDLDLMRQANVAIQAGLPVTVEGLGRFAEVARRLARAVGRDATEAFTRLTNGIAKGEQRILEELGLLTRLEDAMKSWERQTGRNSDALSQQQKITIFYNAVLEEGERKVAAMGAETLSAGERYRQLTTFVRNLTDALAVSITQSPKVVEFLDSIGTSAESSADKISDLADRFGALIDTIVDSPLVGGSLEVTAQEVGIGARIARFLGRQVLGVQPGAFQQNLDRRRAERAQQERLQELRSLETEEQVREELLRIQRETLELLERGSITEAEQNRLLEERRAINESLTRIRAAGRPDPEPIDPATLRKREQLQKQLADQLARLTKDAADEALLQIDRLQKEWIKAFGAIDEETRTKLDRIRASIESISGAETLRDQIREINDEAARSDADLGALVSRLQDIAREAADAAESQEDGSTAQEAFIAVTREAVKALTALATAADKDAAEGVESLNKALRDAQSNTPKTEAEVENLVRQIISIRDEAAAAAESFEHGSEAQEAYNKVVEQSNELLDKYGDTLEKIIERQERDHLRLLDRQARALEQNALAVIDLAAAFGLLGSEAARALQDVARLAVAIQDIARSGNLDSLPAAIAATAGLASQGGARGVIGSTVGGAATGAAIGSVIPGIGTVAGGAIGGVVGFIGGIFGAGKAAKEAERRLREFTAALEDDLAVRELLALGQDEEAERLRLQIQQERELAEVRKAGVDAATVRELERVQALERQSLARQQAEDDLDELVATDVARGVSAISETQAASFVDLSRQSLDVLRAIEANTRWGRGAGSLSLPDAGSVLPASTPTPSAATIGTVDVRVASIDVSLGGKVEGDGFAAGQRIGNEMARGIDESLGRLRGRRELLAGNPNANA